ncbi:SnoaL-like domain-containing protein [Kosakonia oryziphila]|uniref:SnoaL-like domain-containing protein n=1 Tax=Kosakonia oryziphila TaxID=1005667 RepID=A0A1C4FCU8_9ENTR|nr:SnoaL-like domain-containing protein [Kosakonia oryziphila]
MSVVSPVEQQFAAYNAHDIEAFVACFSEDFTAYRLPSTSPSLQGREALRAFYVEHRITRHSARSCSRVR